jgi:two-component system, NarL family, nitrate/nitrite response regulator NarL
MRLVLCDDHDMFLDALMAALTSHGRQIQAVSQHVDQVVDLVVQHQPEVCLLDVVFGCGGSGLVAAASIRDRAPEVKVLLLTGAANDEVWAAYDRHVVDGVVNKVCDLEVLQTSINRVARGERVVEGWFRPLPPEGSRMEVDCLTERERQVLELLVDGAGTAVIADELGISANTVRTHVQNLLHKLGVHDRTKATRMALSRHLLDPMVPER